MKAACLRWSLCVLPWLSFNGGDEPSYPAGRVSHWVEDDQISVPHRLVERVACSRPVIVVVVASADPLQNFQLRHFRILCDVECNAAQKPPGGCHTAGLFGQPAAGPMMRSWRTVCATGSSHRSTVSGRCGLRTVPGFATYCAAHPGRTVLATSNADVSASAPSTFARPTRPDGVRNLETPAAQPCQAVMACPIDGEQSRSMYGRRSCTHVTPGIAGTSPENGALPLPIRRRFRR